MLQPLTVVMAHDSL